MIYFKLNLHQVDFDVDLCRGKNSLFSYGIGCINMLTIHKLKRYFV